MFPYHVTHEFKAYLEAPEINVLAQSMQ
jgi:hypothetical protein